ncbi:MAG: SDR family NAD(P)-dependent oxidoreductase [Proteobacteria bacterium]|nr:SDR family NAD(P)-dependent oxidoreductase [Pseudomonadota bacterium]
MTSQLRAVVTGGASGLGRALSIDIAQRGGRVVIADIDRAGAEDTARQVESAGGEAHVVTCDVRDHEAISALAQQAEEALGTVDLVANNAGVAVGGPFEGISLDDWKWAVDINLWGVIHGCRAFYPTMKRRKHGYIMNVASAAGLVSPPFLSPYNVTKSAVVALSETLYAEAARHGVHVSVLCPTFFTTRIVDSSRGPVSSKLASWAEGKMKSSNLQAPEVARAAVDAVIAGRLYVLPMRDGRMMWRLKRILPGGVRSLMAGRLQSIIPRPLRHFGQR